jgi:hypothetical protein
MSTTWRWTAAPDPTCCSNCQAATGSPTQCKTVLRPAGGEGLVQPGPVAVATGESLAGVDAILDDSECSQRGALDLQVPAAEVAPLEHRPAGISEPHASASLVAVFDPGPRTQH